MTPTELKMTKTKKALETMSLVRDRIVEKLASSTTGAQAHIGLLSQVETDITNLEALILDLSKAVDEEKPVPAPSKRKTAETKEG